MNSSTNETKNAKSGTNSNVVQFNSDERVLDAASEWLVKLDEGLDAEEMQALKTWLATPLHRDTFLEMVALWDKMSVLSELAEIVPHTPEPRRQTQSKQHRELEAPASHCCLDFNGRAVKLSGAKFILAV